MKIDPLSVVLVALLALVVGLPIALRRDRPTGAPADAAAQLVILSPHNEQIRHEFEHAFNAHRLAQGLEPVAFTWLSSGGTSDLRRQLASLFYQAAAEGLEDRGVGYDLFFGGGDFDHNLLARGIEVQRGGRLVRIPLTEPVDLPDSLWREAFPRPDIAGVPLYHPEKQWVGVALSSFGIVYNRDVLGMLELPEPTTWADLRAPGYFGWVTLADPAHSGSIAATYNVILRRLGWNAGWRTLRRVFANTRSFTASAGKVPVDVSAGEAAAGMCIDFYGRLQAGAMPGGRVGYVDPPKMTAITPDPISIVRGAPHRELATEFVAWLLSPEAQSLWQRKLGVVGGPRKFELRRQPIRHDLYTPAHMAEWTDAIQPYEIAAPIPDQAPNFFGAVAPLAHAMAIDVHGELQAAWRAILQEKNPDRRAAMVERFDRMPDELRVDWPAVFEDDPTAWAAVYDANHPHHDAAVAAVERFWDAFGQIDLEAARVRWAIHFREQYEAVAAMASQ